MQTCHEVEPEAELCLLDDRRKLHRLYVEEQRSVTAIAKLASVSAGVVRRKLDDHVIPARTQRVSSHPRCDAAWLAARYLDRKGYESWCRQHSVEPEGDGGHRLSTGAIAKEVGDVSRETVRRWLHHHGIALRDRLGGLRGSAAADLRYSLGAGARAALRRFEQQPLVKGGRVYRDTICFDFATGVREQWALRHNDNIWWLFPGRGWWRHEPVALPEFAGCDPDDFFCYRDKDIARAGFFEQRLLVHGLALRLSETGWRADLRWPEEALAHDLEQLRRDKVKYAASRGFLRGQPGRPRSAPPSGMLLAMATRDWGSLVVQGRQTLADAWSEPGRLVRSIDGLVRKGHDVTRAAIVRKLIMGAADGFPRSVGPKWVPPAFWRALLRDILGINTMPVVLDLDPGCGSLAVAVGSMDGVHVRPGAVGMDDCGPVWAGRAEMVLDDGCTVDVAVAPCGNAVEFEGSVSCFGDRAAQVLSFLPWEEREAVLAMPGVRVVRYRPRPYWDDEVLAVWTQDG